MSDLQITPAYLARLHGEIHTWNCEKLAPAIGVTGVDVNDLKLGLAAAGVAGIGGLTAAIAASESFARASLDLMGKSVYPGTITGLAGIAVAMLNIWQDIKDGDWVGGAVHALSMGPAALALYDLHSGRKFKMEQYAFTTPILKKASYVLFGLGLTCGIGSDSGEVLRSGASRYQEAVKAFQHLKPKAEWVGESAVAYAARVSQLESLLGEMAIIDNLMADALQDEMRELKLTRDVIDAAKVLVQAAIPTAIALQATGWLDAGAISESFQTTVAISAMLIATGALTRQVTRSAGTHRSQLDRVTERYREVDAKATKICKDLTNQLLAPAQPAPPTPAATEAIGSFPSVGPPLTGSASGQARRAGGGVAEGDMARRFASSSVSHDSVGGGEAPSASDTQSDGSTDAGAASGVVAGTSTAGSGWGASGGQSASRDGTPLRPTASVPPRPAIADETGTAETGAGPGGQAGTGVAGAERAPVDTGTVTPDGTREGYTPDRPSEPNP